MSFSPSYTSPSQRRMQKAQLYWSEVAQITEGSGLPEDPKGFSRMLIWKFPCRNSKQILRKTSLLWGLWRLRTDCPEEWNLHPWRYSKPTGQTLGPVSLTLRELRNRWYPKDSSNLSYSTFLWFFSIISVSMWQIEGDSHSYKKVLSHWVLYRWEPKFSAVPEANQLMN